MTDDDDRIRAALRAAHAHDDPPPFALPERAQRRAPLVLAAIGVLAAAAALWLWPRGDLAPRAQKVTQTAHLVLPPMPTDFLLPAPGTDLLATTPAFGDVEPLKGSYP
jgi:hypothetical protein